MRKLDQDLALKDKFQAFNIDLLSKFSPLGLDDSDEHFISITKNKVVLSQDSLFNINIRNFSF